jgi:prepilin-type N-terminal cleavage/methylation domain-containing protein/prepilin-type processing-associated H-X9-DG protein
VRKPRGFTIVELLVVVTIIGVLIGLLLPAVQAAREAARRLHCANNLKQIGLALHNYHTVFRSFPPGNVVKEAGYCPGGRPDVELEDAANWLLAILPFVEQHVLAEGYDFSAYNEGVPNKRVRETFVGTYVCPSDPDCDELTVPAAGPAAAHALNVPYMPGSYRAVSGRSDGRRFLDSSQIASYPGQWRGAIHMVGAMGFEPERLRDIEDGSSHTLLAGESTTRTNRAWRTFWAYSFAYFSLSAVTPQERILLGDYDRCVASTGPANPGRDQPCKRGWGSFHGGGIHFVLCDGSVRFFDTSIDMELLATLATIAGGEPVRVPE